MNVTIAREPSAREPASLEEIYSPVERVSGALGDGQIHIVEDQSILEGFADILKREHDGALNASLRCCSMVCSGLMHGRQ